MAAGRGERSPGPTSDFGAQLLGGIAPGAATQRPFLVRLQEFRHRRRHGLCGRVLSCQ